VGKTVFRLTSKVDPAGFRLHGLIERWLAESGLTAGPMQGTYLIGIAPAGAFVGKWRTLTRNDIAGLTGELKANIGWIAATQATITWKRDVSFPAEVWLG
jgi:hypothetical protein